MCKESFEMHTYITHSIKVLFISELSLFAKFCMHPNVFHNITTKSCVKFTT